MVDKNAGEIQWVRLLIPLIRSAEYSISGYKVEEKHFKGYNPALYINTIYKHKINHKIEQFSMQCFKTILIQVNDDQDVKLCHTKFSNTQFHLKEINLVNVIRLRHKYDNSSQNVSFWFTVNVSSKNENKNTIRSSAPQVCSAITYLLIITDKRQDIT